MITKKHHYLPEFYIKGFLNDNNKIHVYDKHVKQFKKNEFSPSQIFFEWNRNTLIIDGKKDDFIEKLYGFIESKLSPTYNKLKNQTGTIQYDTRDVFDLLLLVSLTFWRLPINDSNSENFIASIPNHELFIKIFNKETNEEASDDIYEEMKKRGGFTEMYKLSRPIIDYLSLDIKNCISNWLIYGAASDRTLHILGDNPIIFRSTPAKNILESELIFPLTEGITLFHNKGKKITQIQPEDRVKIDIMVFLQSDRYVIGPNKEYLNFIQMISNMYDTETKIENLRNDLFKIFE